MGANDTPASGAKENGADAVIDRADGHFQSIGALLVVNSETGAIQSASEVACDALGFDHKALVGKQLRAVVPGLSDALSGIVGTDPTSPKVVPFTHGGETFNVLEYPAGEDRILELIPLSGAQAINLRQENERLQAFMSTVAHDLKAPLRNIKLALDWMAEDDFAPKAVRDNHALALKSTRRTINLLNKLLELAAIEEGRPDFEMVDLARVTSDAQDLLASELQEAGATIDVEPMLQVEGNALLLMRLFLNLLSNCLIYRHSDRNLKIQISCRAKLGNTCEIAVADNGVGIPANMVDRIFKPMERLAAKDEIEGTGLGLTICQSIVGIHGGSIEADADYADGARFVVTLPMRQGE